MLIFWSFVVLLIGIALAFILPPLLRHPPVSTKAEDRNVLNVNIYRERLAELETSGLSTDERTQARLVLEKTLVQELEDEASPVDGQPRARWIAIPLLVLVPLGAVLGYLQSGEPQYLNGIPKPPVTEVANPHVNMPENFDEQVEKLAERLQNEPGKLDDWYMLARAYVVQQRYADAANAYNRGLAMDSERNPRVLTELAEALALGNEDNLAGQPTLLLEAALQADANYPPALWLYGISATQRNDYPTAITYWQRFLAVIPENETETRQTVETFIAEAQQRAGLTPSAATATPATGQPSTTLAVTKSSMAAVRLQIQVSLSPELQAQVSPTQTVFIFARATEGPPMPLGVIRKTAADLPVAVTLDDSNAMVASLKLSSFQRVNIYARISSSGDVRPSAGDFQGEQLDIALNAGDNAVSVVIDHVLLEAD